MESYVRICHQACPIPKPGDDLGGHHTPWLVLLSMLMQSSLGVLEHPEKRQGWDWWWAGVAALVLTLFLFSHIYKRPQGSGPKYPQHISLRVVPVVLGGFILTTGPSVAHGDHPPWKGAIWPLLSDLHCFLTLRETTVSVFSLSLPLDSYSIPWELGQETNLSKGYHHFPQTAIVLLVGQTGLPGSFFLRMSCPSILFPSLNQIVLW